MKFLLKKVEPKKEKELMFSSEIDKDGDFLIKASIDGETWWNICFIDSSCGMLTRFCSVPKTLGLMLSEKGQIVIS